MMRTLRPILRYIHQTTKLIIPSSINSIYMLKNRKLRRFVIPYAISNLMPYRSPLKDEEPWITFEAKEWLKDYLTSNMTVFEYGSGGSTLFFSKRIKKIISVEHNPIWYQHIVNILKSKNISNCEYLLLEPQLVHNSKFDFDDTRSFVSREYVNMSFERYVKSIDTFPDKSFDLVFIDGRARPSCIRHAIDKIRSNGFLMLDNSEREYYITGERLLTDWERMDFFGPGPYGHCFWQTSTWKR